MRLLLWFNDRFKYAWEDWTYFGGLKFADAELGALVLPRGLYIEIADQDPLFDCKNAEDDFGRLKRYADTLGCADRLKIKVFEGGHETDKSDDGIDFLLERLRKKRDYT